MQEDAALVLPEGREELGEIAFNLPLYKQIYEVTEILYEGRIA